MTTLVLRASCRRVEFKATNTDEHRDSFVDIDGGGPRLVLGPRVVEFIDRPTDDAFVRIVIGDRIEVEPIGGTEVVA
jgi:hypothetical protein